MSASVEESSPFQPGALLLGKYRVERVLGSGGMGLVLAAEHIDLGEHVAIKLLHGEALTNPSYVARFMREARAAARIRSEHAVQVHDVGRLPDGMPYMVMEYLDGVDVSRRIKTAGPFTVEEAAELGIQTCVALAVAHARGIVHRDVKPANLFVSRRADGSPALKLIDFGISKMTGPVIGDDGDSSMTHSQSLIGSPHYMAPEQMRSARDVDARADVWALGATLHKMVTGKAPFRGDSVVAIFETMLAGYPGLGASHPEIPAAFATVIERCLQLEPADRAQSVAEVAEALAPFAPVRAHHLVERVVGTLANPVDSSQSFPSVGGGPSSVSQPVVSAVSEASKALAREATSATAMGEHTGATQAAWGQVASSRGRARWPLGVAALLLLGGALAFFTRSSPEPDAERSLATTTGDDATASAPAATTSDATAIPVVSADEKAAPPPAAATSAHPPTASATASAAAKAAPPPAAPPTPKSAPPGHVPGRVPPAQPKKPDSLWSDAF